MRLPRSSSTRHFGGDWPNEDMSSSASGSRSPRSRETWPRSRSMQSADESALLRVCVICEGTTIAAWQTHCLEALFAVAGVDPTVVIVDAGKGGPDRGHQRSRSSRLESAFRIRHVARRSRALRPIDVRGLLAGVPHMPFDDDALLDVIEPLGLDVVLQLSAATVPASFVRLARRGVWSLHTGGDRTNHADDMTGYREILSGTAVTTAELRCRNESDAATVLLGQAFFRTRAHSYVRNLDDVLFGAARLPARACRAILAGAEPSPVSDTEHGGTPARAAPTTQDTLTFATRLGANFVRSQLTAILRSPQWNVGVVDAPIHRFLDASFEPRVKWFPKPRRGQFVADPFGLPDGSAQEWLAESYDYATDRGVIAVVERGHPGMPRESGLPVNAHASYPYLLRHRGEVYCVPQLEGARGIRIFRAVHYPTEWEDAGVLVADVVARDPTPFEHEGRWWLTYTDAAAPLTDLCVWWANDLFGQWHPHASNPVKVDVRSARPAGTPFVHAGALYRPAQDCSQSYGGAVAICRVDVLTTTEFREEVVRVIRSLPGSYRRGTHTLASVGEATLVDGKRFVFTLAGSRLALRSRLQRTSS